MSAASQTEVAELAAMLALRAAAGGGVSYYRIARDAVALIHQAKAAEHNAVRLCELTDYQAKFDRTKAAIEEVANQLASSYGLTAHASGDPRTSCLCLRPVKGSAPVPGHEEEFAL